MLYELISTHSEPVHATKQWREKAIGQIVCPVCNHINPNWYPQAIDIVLDDCPDYKIYDHVWFTGVSIFHKNFILQVKEHINPDLIGQCFLSDGKLVDEYVTYYDKPNMLIRGNRKTIYRECYLCNNLYCYPIESKYSLKVYLTSQHLYINAGCSLYFDEYLAGKLDLSAWPDAELEPIEIRDEPLDGYFLPCDPPDASWREKSSIYF